MIATAEPVKIGFLLIIKLSFCYVKIEKLPVGSHQKGTYANIIRPDVTDLK